MALKPFLFCIFHCGRLDHVTLYGFIANINSILALVTEATFLYGFIGNINFMFTMIVKIMILHVRLSEIPILF